MFSAMPHETSARPRDGSETGQTGTEQGQSERDPAQTEPAASADAVKRQHGQSAARHGAAEQLQPKSCGPGRIPGPGALKAGEDK